MNVAQVLRAITPRLETHEKRAIVNALYETASAEFDHANRYRLYNYHGTNSDGYRYHMNRYREYRDYAQIVDEFIPIDLPTLA